MVRNPQQLLHPRVSDLKFDSRKLGFVFFLVQWEPFKQNISIGMKKKRFVFFRVSTTIERANHNGEQKGKEL
ncbi:hypothetical protein Peur_037311 [Populus x canadensis]